MAIGVSQKLDICAVVWAAWIVPRRYLVVVMSELYLRVACHRLVLAKSRASRPARSKAVHIAHTRSQVH